MNDFLRVYTDRSKECSYQIPNQSELDAIFNDMNKHTAESRKINCECCGYETCEKMAVAIFNGFNYKENCIHYVKDEVEKEKERALELAREVEHDKAKLAESQMNEEDMDAVAEQMAELGLGI